MKESYHITTFGCAMNTSDSERAAAVCELMGYEKTENIDEARLIIINSCSVRQKAEDRVMGMGKRIQRIKAQNPETIAILTGCMAMRDGRQPSEDKNIASQELHEKKLHKVMDWLDFTVPIKDIHKLPEILKKEVKTDFTEYLSITPKYSTQTTSFIPISTGCNKFCTFCIVPFTRGKEVYRPFQEIKEEFQKMLSQGFKEITLLGQNVNSWRDIDDSYKAKSGEKDFAYLLEELALIEGDHWIRFTSSHPYDINMRLAEVIAEKPNLAKQFHFALQSGDNNMLKRMNRHYTIEEFSEKVEAIRSKIPMVGISTDIIVGFPGETEEEFQNTAKALETLKFDQVFISEYSNRKGTLADKFYKDDIPNEVKAQRKEILNEIVGNGNIERNKSMVDTIQKVLVYKKNKKGIIGRTENAKDVEILNGNPEIGGFVNVKVTDYSKWSLKANILG